MTPLESIRGHHLPIRAASARAARGRCFDPKREATAPGCRACSVSREHRVGSLLVVGQHQTQAHSSSSTMGSSTTPDDGSHIHRILRPRCRTESSWRRAGRVWACTRPLQSVHAAAELVCRGKVVVDRVLRHEYCCCGTCLFERSEFLIATPPPKKSAICACVVCSTNLGFSGEKISWF